MSGTLCGKHTHLMRWGFFDGSFIAEWQSLWMSTGSKTKLVSHFEATVAQEVEWVIHHQKAGGSIPGSCNLHVEVSLGEMLNTVGHFG